MQKKSIQIMVPCKVIASPQSPYKTVAGIGVPIAQPDLLYMQSVLVSTGSNLNDDVFMPGEMWTARSTPVLKPVDWEHNMGRELTEAEQKENPGKVVVDNQTIGVMYNAYVTDEQGQVIDEAKASASDFEVPERFDIVDEAVIWKGNFPTVASRIEKGAAEGTLFVSMEAWFSDYDYLVGDRVIARNEETSFLDDSLRANGGSGAFGSSSVKRVLRNITFGGKGIVARPANEPSVIKSVTHTPIGASEAANKVIAKHVIDDLGNTNQTDSESREDMIQMSEQNKTETAGVPLDKYTAATEEAVTLRAEVKTVAGERDAAVAEKSDLEGQVENISSAFIKGAKLLDTVLPGLGAKLAEAKAEDFFSVVSDAIAASNTSADELKAKLAEATEKLEAQAAEAKSRDRLVEINKVLSGLLTEDNAEAIAAKASKMLGTADKMDDESFAAYLEDYKETVALAAKAPPFKKKKKGDDEEDDSSDASTAGEGETDTALLDSIVAAEKTPSAGETPKPIDFDKAMSGLVTSMLKSATPQSTQAASK